MLFKILFIIFCVTNLFAQNKHSDSNSTCTLDTLHSISSDSIEKVSTYLDNSLSSLFTDSNETLKQSSALKKEIDMIDFLHKNEKYIDDTRDSFVQLRLNSFFQSIGDHDHKASLRAYIALEKTTQRLNLFIETIQNGPLIEQFQNSNIENDGRTKIGINYFSPSYYSIESKYSIGIRGLEPYIQARFKTEFTLDNWIIEPNQSFRYRIYDNIFEEKTYLYFDTKLNTKRFFRIYISRGTQSDQEGMDYSASLIYTYIPLEKTSIGLSQSFTGNTQYRYLKNSELVHYNKINSYKTQLSWRHNIWKKWFYYEVIPAVSFDKMNNFQANYQISFLADFYFGAID